MKRETGEDSERSYRGLIEYFGMCLEGMRKKGPKLLLRIVYRQGLETGTSLPVQDLPNTCSSPGPLHQPVSEQLVQKPHRLRGHATSSFIDVTKQRHSDRRIRMSSGWTAFDTGLGHIKYIPN